MSWKKIIKEDENSINQSFDMVKGALKDLLKYKPNDVKNDEGEYIEEEVKEVFDVFKDLNEAIKDFEEEVSSFADQFGIYYKGPYGVTINTLKYAEED